MTMTRVNPIQGNLIQYELVQMCTISQGTTNWVAYIMTGMNRILWNCMLFLDNNSMTD